VDVLRAVEVAVCADVPHRAGEGAVDCDTDGLGCAVVRQGEVGCCGGVKGDGTCVGVGVCRQVAC
jgi:hypothetical protein